MKLETPAVPRSGTTPMNGIAMQAARVSVRYGARRVLMDITLAAHRGRILAVIGPSGCGKTSFLCSLNRLTDLIPGCRVDGRIVFGDDDILSRSIDTLALRRRVGMIFQSPNPFPVSIRRNLDLPLRDHGMRRRDDREATVERALREVGLWNEVKDRLDEPALALSGGQQQRLCLARALALNPEVLLLDEPCSALDPVSGGVVEDLIAGLRDRCAVVIVTHNLAQARRVADEAALFWSDGGPGRLVEWGPVERLFEEPADPVTAAYVRGVRG